MPEWENSIWNMNRGPIANRLVRDLEAIQSVRDVKNFQPFGDIFGSRVIIIGGGAQVAQVALGAVNEADRHNIRGERISVDTIPLVGERTLALAVDAVSRLPRASILVLAGSIMGGDISKAVDRVREPVSRSSPSRWREPCPSMPIWS